MNRYMTRHYVAIDWTEAVRLAKLDSTFLSDIRCHQNVELLHRTHWWAWWSDERLTTAIGLPENLQPETLSSDAVELIFGVWSGGLIAPQCGWALLANVQHISDSQLISLGYMNSGAAVSRWEKLILIFSNENPGVLYRHCYLDRLGYKCDISSELP
jgi:hypothetical protein